MPVTPAYRRQKQDYCKSEASLDYIAIVSQKESGEVGKMEGKEERRDRGRERDRGRNTVKEREGGRKRRKKKNETQKMGFSHVISRPLSL